MPRPHRPAASVLLAALAALAVFLGACTFTTERAPEAFRGDDPGAASTGTTGPESPGSDADDLGGSATAGVSDGAEGGEVGGSDPSPADDPDARLDDQWHDAAARGGPDVHTETPFATECLELAERPLTARAVVGDPVADLRTGDAPSILGTDVPLFDVVEFDTFEEYRDPSTPSDLDALLAAWRNAGFRGGIAAKWQSGNSLSMVTVVEFASPSDARAAALAHIRDLCQRTVRSERNPDGAGMTLLRETGAVRSISAAGAYEISFYVCPCLGSTDDARFDALGKWRAHFEDDWAVAAEDEGVPTA